MAEGADPCWIPSAGHRPGRSLSSLWLPELPAELAVDASKGPVCLPGRLCHGGAVRSPREEKRSCALVTESLHGARRRDSLAEERSEVRSLALRHGFSGHRTKNEFPEINCALSSPQTSTLSL